MNNKSITVLRHLKWPLWIAALALFIYLILSQGISELGDALRQIGWGIAAISLFHALPLGLNTVGWRLVIPGHTPPNLLHLFLIRWTGQAINNLLPVAQVGGELIRARLLAASTSPGPLAAASVMVDFTLGIITQALFTIVGVLLLVSHVGINEHTQNLLLGALLICIPLLLFYVVQRMGLIGLGARLASKMLAGDNWRQLIGNAQAMNEVVMATYSQHASIISSALIRLLAWFIGAVETWLVFYFLHQPISVVDAIVFECVGYAARSMAFAIPGALGVTEAALMLAGSLMGIGAAPALVLAMVKRIRELIVGLPGLLIWTALEYRIKANKNPGTIQ